MGSYGETGTGVIDSGLKQALINCTIKHRPIEMHAMENYLQGGHAPRTKSSNCPDQQNIGYTAKSMKVRR